MKWRVFLCEKPDQARILAEALGNGEKQTGFWEGPGWRICWAFGHLLEPYPPEEYHPSFKEWNMASLPIVPRPFLFRPRDKKAAHQLKIIAGVLRGANEVVLATDADREGEMIGREILERIGWRGPILRLWLSDLTIPAVKKALSCLKQGQETISLHYAALARTQADWLVGINMSRAATLVFNPHRNAPPLSIGRVQTPTLALIVRLDRRIKNFTPQTYFEIEAEVAVDGSIFRMRYAPPAEKRLFEKNKAAALAQVLLGKQAPIKMDLKKILDSPPSLFDLDSLQQEANAKFGWSAAKTMGIAQRLYEEHRILTYPRTDCQFLPEIHQEKINDILRVILSIPHLAHLGSHLESIVIRDSVYNDKKITAHHAIVPTLQKPNWGVLTADERSLWELVARRFVAAHIQDAVFLSLIVKLSVNDLVLIAKGKSFLELGWRKALYESLQDEKEKDGGEEEGHEESHNDEWPDQILPASLKDGAVAKIVSASTVQKITKPPPRFTEKSLIGAMKNIASYVEEESAKKRLRQTSGIGTPATRAGIIETLKERGYIRLEKRQIFPTPLGEELIERLEKYVPEYCDPGLTASWEDVLDDIAKGKTDPKQFWEKTVERVSRDVALLKELSCQQEERWRLCADDFKENPHMKEKGGTSLYASIKTNCSGKNSTAKENIINGVPLLVKYKDREKAKSLGAKWDPQARRWVAPAGISLDPFKRAGFLERK